MNEKKRAILDVVLGLIIFSLSFIYFYKIIFASGKILVHGDYRYGLTVQQHIQYHLNKIFVNAPKLPFFAVLYLAKIIFGDILAEKIFTVFILFVSALFIYISNKHFLKRIFGENDWKISISAFVGTLLFLYNPWTINKIHHHYWLVLSLATSYLLLAEVDKLIYGKFSYFQVLLISGLVMLIATQIQGLIIYAGFMIVIYSIFSILVDKSNFVRRILSKQVILSLFIVFLLNAFWIMPQTATALSGISKPGWYGIVAENIDTLSRRCSVLNVVTATNRWIWGGFGWLSTPNFNLNFLGIDVWKPISLVPFIIGVSSLLFLKLSTYKKKYIVYFAILLIASILFSTGSYYPAIGDLCRKIFLDTGLGWIIRDPYKNTGVVIISLSFLTSIVALTALRCNIKFKYLLLALIVVPTLIWGWPALTGDLNEHLKPYLVKYPKDLEQTIEYLDAHLGSNYNALWYPPQIDKVYFVYEDVPQISTIGNNLNIMIIENEELAKYIENALKRHDKNSLESLLKKFSVKYVILRHDLIESNQKKRLLNDIQLFESLFEDNKITKFGNFTIYKFKPNQIVAVTPSITYSTSPSLNKDFEFENTIQCIYFKNFYIVTNNFISFHFNNYTIEVKNKHHAPEKYWSFGTFAGGWLKRFIPYLEKFGIENWQSDYGYGLVFTWATKRIPENLKVRDNDIIYSWNFNTEKEFLEWKNTTPEKQFNAIYKLEWKEEALIAKLYNSTWGWKTINSPFIPTKVGNAFRFTLKIKGENASAVHVKVMEFDSNKKCLAGKYIKGVGSGKR